MNNRELQTDFLKLIKSREKYYAPKYYKAIRAQIVSSVAQFKQGAKAPQITGEALHQLLEAQWFEISRTWAARVRRDLVRTKARLPIGFSERMYQLIREQYAIDFLNMSEGLTDTTREFIRQRLEFAYLAGWSNDQTVEYLLSDPNLTSVRARLIARTESVSAANAGAMIAAKEQGNYNKIWISANDRRTRPDHIRVPKEPIPFDQPFIVGGFEMMQPGDRGGKDGRPKVPAKEVCNCRCTIGFRPVKRVSQ